MAERGSVARTTYDRVQEIAKDGTTSLKGAFERMAEQTGRSAGTIQAAYYRHARKIGATSPPPRRTPAAKSSSRGKRSAPAPRGSIAETTYAQAQALVRTGTSLNAAFAELARKTGRNAGTVQAAYYRHARKIGATGGASGADPAKRRRRARTAASVTSTASGDLAKRLADAGAALSALSSEVEALERDAARWREVLRVTGG